MKISSILAAVDFSDDARHAAVRAGLLAATHGAQLTLLHVINSSSLAVLHRLRRASPDERRVIDRSRQALDTIARELKDRSNVAATIAVKVGLVMEEILSSSAQADLLVLGAHGMNPARHLFLGSTSERVLRKRQGPVLVIKRPADGPYHRVLVTVDFSKHSVSCLTTAMHLRPTAELLVVHAFDVPFAKTLWLAGTTDEDIEEYCEEERQRISTDLRNLIQAAGGDPNRIRYAVQRGDPAPIIVDKERQSQADLIIIGKHGQSVLEDLFLGSVTRHILASATCDVLIVNDGE